jgi:LPXTG-motif cell wall-anchored protein
MGTKVSRSAIAGVAVAAVCLVVSAPAGATSGQADPPGNNGTVKIDDVPFDDHPNNEPHVGCVFQVDFYGFDAGDLDATVTFTHVPPTGDNEDILDDEVAIGEDAAGGGTDLDASATYDLTDALSGVEPHPQQGIHLRLTVHAEGSIGADTKFKEFWVTGCGKPPTSTTTTTKPGHGSTTTSSTTSSTSSPDGSTTTTTEPGHGEGTTTTTEQGANPPGGPATTAPTGSSGAGGAAGQLPDTGSEAAPLAAAGLALVAVGGGTALAAHRLRNTRTHA